MLHLTEICLHSLCLYNLQFWFWSLVSITELYLFIIEESYNDVGWMSELSPTSCPWHTSQACLWWLRVDACDTGQVHECETVHEHAHDSFKCMPLADYSYTIISYFESKYS